MEAQETRPHAGRVFPACGLLQHGHPTGTALADRGNSNSNNNINIKHVQFIIVDHQLVSANDQALDYDFELSIITQIFFYFN